MQFKPHRLSVAPMMDWTDRHCRAFHRVITRRALLYTEMVTASAVIHGKRQRLIGFGENEHPVALQLGGSEPEQLAEATRIGAGFGYDEINLNVGCPSDRVQSGTFGACLMAEPERVARCIDAMRKATDVPVTVKCRIGIDNQDSERDLTRFVTIVAATGCNTFIVHARKAWLQGLSPKQNREIPPLDYARVHRLKAARPDLTIVINGGLADVDGACSHLDNLDGAMLGRAAYQTPYVLADVDRVVFGDTRTAFSRHEIVEHFLPYVEGQLAAGVPLHAMTRHILGLFHGQSNARKFRRILSEEGVRKGAGLAVLECALAVVSASPPERVTETVEA